MGDTSLGDFTIRAARIEDLDAIIALTKSTHAEHTARVPDVFMAEEEPATVDWARRSLSPDSSDNFITSIQSLVCDDGIAVCGHLIFWFFYIPHNPSQYEKCAVIADISLQPESRGKGLGKRLLAEAVARAQREGATAMSAQVWDGNRASVRTFGAAGFAPSFQEFRLRLDAPLSGKPPATARKAGLWQWLQGAGIAAQAAVILIILGLLITSRFN